MPSVYESNRSRNLNRQTGRKGGTRIFTVYDVASPDAVEALFGTATTPDATPKLGDAFSASNTGLRAIDYNIEKTEGMTDQYTLTWVYGTVDVDDTTVLPDEEGYVQIATRIARKQDLFYREGATIPTSGNVAGNNTTDIAGTSVDIQGTPVSLLRFQQVLSIGEVLSFANFVSNIDTYAGLVGRRNNATFQGAPTGSVVYAGASASRIDIEKFRVEHEFYRDEFFHLVQVPARDEDGFPILVDDVADEVYFRQPFPNTGNFASISTNF